MFNLYISQKQKWFRSDQKETAWSLNRHQIDNVTKLNRQPLYKTNSVKYLGIKTDSKHNWKSQIDDIALKLIRSNAMLHMVKDYINVGISKAIYHALFESHINCL